MTTVPSRVVFGAFEFDLRSGELWKGGRTLRLQPQPARVLSLLVAARGGLITREQMRQHLWDDSTFVDYDVGLDYCVNRIRTVLGDSAQAPRFVETVPRRGYRFIAPVTRLRSFEQPTLAVLPFANLSGDPAKEYFADGITDVLITELARIPVLRVISRQSVLHLKGSHRRLGDIARDLGVDGVVEGTVLQEAARVRVNAQLVLPDPERHVWAESYDCDVSAVLETQREAAVAIAMSIGRTVSGSEPALPPSTVPKPVSPQILDLYLRARVELGKMSADGIGKALGYLREVTAKAPHFAQGVAEHALCLGCLAFWGHAPGREIYPSSRQMALSAIAIDETLDLAHAALGMATWLANWDVTGAEREFRRAIELSPSNPDGHFLLSIFLSTMGRSAEAMHEIDCALKLDSTRLLQNTAAGWIYLYARKPAQAEAQARLTIQAFPDSLHAWMVLGWSTWRQQRRNDAVAAFEKAVEISREAFSLAFLGHVYGQIGRAAEARAILTEIEALFRRGQAPPMALASVHSGLGDHDAALEWLDTAYQLRDETLFWIGVFPPLDPLRSDIRFRKLERSMASAGAAAATATAADDPRFAAR